MSNRSSRDRHSLKRRRTVLAERLRARFEELDETALTRIYAVSEPDRSLDPEYVAGLRAAVPAALTYGIAVIETGEGRAPPTPLVLLSQARLAARRGIELEIVLRRYLVGYTLLGDFVAQEAARGDLLAIDEVQRLFRDQSILVDRLVTAVTAEYRQEERSRSRSQGARHDERVRDLVAGGLLDTSEFQYDFEAWHVGTVATGPRAVDALRDLARRIDCSTLRSSGGRWTTWAWFGRREKMSSAELEHAASTSWPSQVSLAIGEPGRGLTGWRLTHRQACAALPLATDRPTNVVRYAEEALLVSMRQDDLLVRSLTQIYLDPLADEPDGGETLRETLRAYFAASRNVSSTAARLKVSRKTVSKRLARIEKLIGRRLDSCGAELEAALRLHDSRGLSEDPAGSRFG
jgi:PucR C-terminal helix-turn-helix domain/GGDEF-like domain